MRAWVICSVSGIHSTTTGLNESHEITEKTEKTKLLAYYYYHVVLSKLLHQESIVASVIQLKLSDKIISTRSPEFEKCCWRLRRQRS